MSIIPYLKNNQAVVTSYQDGKMGQYDGNGNFRAYGQDEIDALNNWYASRGSPQQFQQPQTQPVEQPSMYAGGSPNFDMTGGQGQPAGSGATPTSAGKYALTPLQVQQLSGGSAASADDLYKMYAGLGTVDPAAVKHFQEAYEKNPSLRLDGFETDAGMTYVGDPAASFGKYSLYLDPNTGQPLIGTGISRETWGQDVSAVYDLNGRPVGVSSGDSTALGLAKFALMSAAAYGGVNAADGFVNGASAGASVGASGAGAGAGGTMSAEQAAFLEANMGAGAPMAGMPGSAYYNALQPYIGTEGANLAYQGVNAANTLGIPNTPASVPNSGSSPSTPGSTAPSNLPPGTPPSNGGSGSGGQFTVGGVPVSQLLPIAGAAATLASGGSTPTPQAPDYVKQAIATSNSGKYNEVTPYGTITWSLRPGADPANPQPGDYIRTTTLSPQQQALYDKNTANQLQAGQVGGNMLAELGQGRQSVQDALYRRATQYYDQNFGDQEAQLRTRLTNQGLNEGSEAFERELRNFRQGKDSAYADATDRAIAGANQQENDAVARIVNILNMSKATNPTSGNSAGGAGTDLLTAANQAYAANLGATNAQNAADAQQQNAMLQLVLAGMKFYGG